MTPQTRIPPTGSVTHPRDFSPRDCEFESRRGETENAAFVGKKQRNLKLGDDRRELGDVWTFVSVDPDSRMVPTYFIGKRSAYSANCFVEIWPHVSIQSVCKSLATR